MIALHDSDGAPVIIGGGLAGLITALALAPQPVLLLTGAPLAPGIVERAGARRHRRQYRGR
jgi:2-polyprenyl-6-methoxyphenol hydroxylase-like FAD-dependent oxidoreductase